MGDVTELGELARNSLGRGVVGKSRLGAVGGGELRVDLEETNKTNDLELAAVRESIPLLGRGKVGGREGLATQRHGPGEVEVGLDAVSNKGSHGNTAVLDLGVTEELGGKVAGSSVDLERGQIQRIIEANDGVELLSERFQVGLRCVCVYRKGHCEVVMVGFGVFGFRCRQTKRGKSERIQ